MDWSQYRHHCTWLQTLRIREDTVISSVFQLGVSLPLTTVSFLLLFGFGTNCRLLSLCPLPSRPPSLDWRAPRRLRRQFRDIRPVFISHSSTFLSVCGTWIYRLFPALHAHLPCTTLLNSEECALSEKKKKKKTISFSRLAYFCVIWRRIPTLMISHDPEVQVRQGQNLSERLLTMSGVRQGCVLAPALFLSLIHIWRCRRIERCRSRWSPYH